MCSLFHVPALFVKAVTNLRDAKEEDMEAFHNNLRRASEELMRANIRIVEYLSAVER